jgi:predicted ATPase
VVAFGLPQTLEHLPQCTVQAALAIRHLAADTDALTREMLRPAVRLAAHLGTLLVAEATGESPWRWLAVGETLALPVRLLGHAAAGEILVTSEVGRFVEGWCAVQPHAGPSGTETILVTGLKPRPSPLRLRGERPLSQFVGRERELTTLTDLLAQAIEGRGQVVGVVGEPGIGKSRLLYEFQQELRAQSIPSVEGQCLSYGQAIPLGPVLDLLRQHSGITEADAPEAVTEKVRLTLQTAGIDSDDAAPYVCQLLGLPVASERLANLSPEIRKTRTFKALRQIYLGSSQRHPLVLAVENLHWIDPTSEAFLGSLTEYLAGSCLFILCTYRPGYRPPWIDKSYATQIVLPPLSVEDSRRMLGSVLPAGTISASLEQQILTKAQGNPFFLEEIAQTLVEQGALRHESGMTLPPAMQLPATVQEVLGVRIDRLPADEKALLQTLAVIGHVCSRRLLMHVVAQPNAEISQRLSNLQAAELIYELPAVPEPTVSFKHILTQDVAYHSLAQARQRALHERTAQAIEGLVGERLVEHYGELAHHYTRSGNTQQAVVYLQRAGQQAKDRSAYGEAIIHLTRGLELLPSLPESPERIRHELDIQIALGEALIVTKGRASSDAEQTFTRACKLCQQLGETPQLFPVLAGLRMIAEARGELPKARELAEQLLSIAQHAQDPARLMRAYNVLGATLLYMGAFAQARGSLEQGIALDALPRDRSAAIRLAATLHCLRREAPAAQAQAEVLMELARQQEFPDRVVRGAVLRGWSLAAQGQRTEGMAQMHQGLDTQRSLECV